MKINRRHFLRGAGVSLALPWLNSLAPARGPAAQPPRRLVCINTPLSLHPPFFFPKQAGANYELTPYLEVVKDFREDFTVVSGLSHPDVGNSHDSNLSFLTGAPHPERRAGFRNSISVDQVAAEHVRGRTRYTSLTLACGGGDGLSWTRSGAPIPAHSGPSGVFAALFLDGRPEEVQAQARRLRSGRSILDTIREQSRNLQSDLGAADRDKLDEYFTSVRELEQRLVQDEEWSKKPRPKVDAKLPQNTTNPADLIGKSRLWFDLMHLALQTDSTRLITLQLLSTSAVPPIQGVTYGHHDLSHHGQNPAKIAQLKVVELEKMKTLRDFLAKLKQTREEGDSLLDRTMVFFSSNLGNAAGHSARNLPVLLAGGGFRHGRHLAFDPQNNTPLCNLFVSLLQRMGLEADRFSSSTGTLTGLEPMG